MYLNHSSIVTGVSNNAFRSPVASYLTQARDECGGQRPLLDCPSTQFDSLPFARDENTIMETKTVVVNSTNTNTTRGRSRAACAARLLPLLLLLTLPAPVQAQYYYTTNSDNTITITGYTGSGGAVTIPSAINGLTITNIGDHAFNEGYVPTGITIPPMPASLTASVIQDRREEIARETKRYIAHHFPDGKMPPKHDFSKSRPVPRNKQTASGYTTSITNGLTPGGIGYGVWDDDTALIWTNSTVVDFYAIAPAFLGQSIYYLYLTSTCRAQLGTEALVDYNSTYGPEFWVYDWAQPANSRWQVLIDLPNDNPQYLTTRPDEFAITRQMVHIRNGTYNTGFSNGLYYWENRVELFDFNRAGWDLMYSYDYTTAYLTNNVYTEGSYYGSWGPIIETFHSYTNINPVGFDLIHLFQDGNPNPLWLTPSNCYPSENLPVPPLSTSTNWQLLAVAPYTSFVAAINSNNLVSSQQTNFGTLYVTVNTNAASFWVSTNVAVASSGWVTDPSSNSCLTVVGFPPAQYSINFYPVPGLATPTQQVFVIATNSITTVQATYGPAPPLSITTTSPLPTGTVGIAYSAIIAATNGTTPYSWSITSGGLPDGLSLGNSNGVISGRPTTYCTSNFTVQVTDANSLSATQAFSLTINPTAWQTWQLRYFGCTTCPQADPNADPYGKGMSNTNQFLAGLNPTNNASVFKIVSLTPQGSDIIIVWQAGGGRTNIVQAASTVVGGNNFNDISPAFILPGAGDVFTNWVDPGGATYSPTRFYRIRLGP